ncbi:MAG TPA: YSC84-related protein [Noviherbaspirillum sp.]
MQRRKFMLVAVSLGTTGLAVSGCTTTGTAATTPDTVAESAQRRSKIDASASSTLDHLYNNVKGSRTLVAKANGVLIFPSVIAAGLGIGGEYGEGALRAHGTTLDYYSIASVSIGLQAGAQSKAIIFLFMTQDALNKFRSSQGWAVGVDASVAVLKVGANGELDTSSATGPVLAFVLTNAGLMANLSLEGTKVTRLKS